METCPKCGARTISTGHGEYCPYPTCKWGWEVEMDGSPLRPPKRDRFPERNPLCYSHRNSHHCYVSDHPSVNSPLQCSIDCSPSEIEPAY